MRSGLVDASTGIPVDATARLPKWAFWYCVGFIKGFAAKFDETVEITRVIDGDENTLRIVVA